MFKLYASTQMLMPVDPDVDEWDTEEYVEVVETFDTFDDAISYMRENGYSKNETDGWKMYIGEED